MRVLQVGNALSGVLVLALATAAQAQPGNVTSLSRLTEVATSLEQSQTPVTGTTTVQLGIWGITYQDGGDWNAASATFNPPRLLALSGLASLGLADPADNDWQSDPSLRLDLLVPGGIDQAQVRLEAASAIGAVPEPASWLLMLSGFGLVGAMVRRRRAHPHLA